MSLLVLHRIFVCLLLIVSCQAFKVRNQEPQCSSSTALETTVITASSRQLQQPLNCNLNTNRQFTASLLIDFYGQPSKVTTTEVSILRAIVRDAYNQLPFCTSPQFMRIDSATLVTNLATLPKLDEALFTLEFALVTSCRGCSTNATIFAPPPPTTTLSPPSCPCEPPSVSLFRVAFQDRLDLFLTSRQISSIYYYDNAAAIETLPICPTDYVTFDTSNVVVEFYGCPLELTQSHLNQMASEFVATYNRRNVGLNTRYCDRFFREITSATAILEDNFDVIFGRRLVEDEEEAEFPLPMTTSVHSKRSHRRGGRSSRDDNVGRRSLEDTFECPDFFEIRLEVTARCRGCNATTTTLFDEAEDVNYFYGYDDDNTTDDDAGYDYGSAASRTFPRISSNNLVSDPWTRHLSDPISHRLSEEHRELQVSPCRCPVKPEYRAITEEEMNGEYGIVIESLVNLPGSLSVEDVIEIERVACDPNINDFQSRVDISIGTNSSEGAITQDIIDTITRNFARSYNDLSDRYCDPFFRRVNTVTAINQTIVPVRRDLFVRKPTRTNFTINFVFSFSFFISGVCRFCPQKGPIFNDAVRRRMVMHDQQHQQHHPMKVVTDNKYRRLQTTDQCFCAAVNVASGGPTEREFADRFTGDFARLTAVGALTDQYAVSFIKEEVDSSFAPTQGAECSTAAQCVSLGKGTMCVNNECLNEGNPRFTLTWSGDDDLDLSVFTPTGSEIFYGNEFDPVTKGVFDTSYVQNAFGDHVESIYFPKSGSAPGGTYRISIATFERIGAADNWKLEVYAFGDAKPVLMQDGSGNKNIDFNFVDKQAVVPTTCNAVDVTTQCCSDQDCVSDSVVERICINRQCVAEGRLRFTLTSFGNDNLQLVVVTPDFDEILDENPFDEATGGIFENDRNEFVQGNTFHTESVSFRDFAPFGEYTFFVNVLEQRGVLDPWKIVVSFEDEDVIVEKGAGFSDYFYYDVVQCNQDSDCPFSEFGNETCVVGLCVVEGTPRITLTWEGGDDLDLYVIPPVGNRLDFDSPSDATSGGTLEADLEAVNGTNVENVYFDFNGDSPLGEYRFGVDTYFVRGRPDEWEITVYVGGEEVKRFNAVGDVEFSYIYKGWEPPDTRGTTDPRPAPTPAPTRTSVPVFCFSGESTVVTKGRGKIYMKDLQLGDEVATSDKSFSTVYSFGHRHESLAAEYLQLLPSKLEISAEHMIFVEGGRAVPASLLRVGDRLLNGETVVGIQRVARRGMYAPFTMAGSLLVNNVTVSSYIAFQESDRLRLECGLVTPLSYHWMGHLFQLPHRLWCSYVMNCGNEVYTDTGVSTWVDLPLRMARVVLSTDVTIAVWLFPVMLVLLILLVFSVLEIYVATVLIASVLRYYVTSGKSLIV